MIMTKDAGAHMMNDDKNVDFERSNVRKSVDRIIYDKISAILLENCIPPNIKGYSYLREGIYLAVQDINIINNMMNGLYLHIADNYGASVCKVERSIRHAIEVAWNRTQLCNLRKELGVDVDYSVYKPSNGEFIALVAHRLLVMYG